jgi:uncharacterized protein (DUF305 family)
MKNICKDNLTDREYLQHMIKHHNVAIDISLILQKISKYVEMQDILRKLIWIQNYEIIMMKDLLYNLPDNITDNINNNTYNFTTADLIKPNKLELTNTYCNPHFFDQKNHMNNLQHIVLDDIVYLEHMIPHHQVAVDMSKILLKNTKSDIMLFLAYRIIKSQQEEIITLDNFLLSLKNNKYFYYQSELLFNKI